MEDEDAQPEASDEEREKVDIEADLWRREGGLNRDELVVSRLEETQTLIATAADWLELDSPDEGIRFDSELVSSRIEGAYRADNRRYERKWLTLYTSPYLL